MTDPMTEFMTNTHSLGQMVKEADGTYTLRYERHLKHPIARVWQAIADPAHVAIWLGRMTLEQRVGGHFEMRFFGEDSYHMAGKVTELDPPHLLAYGWKAGEMPENPIRWELAEDGPDATLLTFSFGNINPDHAAGAGAGWHLSLDRMEQVVDGSMTEYGAWPEARRVELEVAYTAQLRQGAATL